MHIPVSTIRLSNDGQKLYSVSKFSNEIYETNVGTGATKIMATFKEERCLDLIFDIVDLGKALLLTPRNAEKFHILNKKTCEDKCFFKENVCPYDNGPMGFFSFRSHNKVYTVNRKVPVVTMYDTESSTWKIVNDEMSNEVIEVDTYDYDDEIAVFLSSKENTVLMYDLKSNSIKKILSEDSLNGARRVYAGCHHIWIYKEFPSRLVEYDIDGNKLYEYDIDFKKGQSPRMIVKGDYIDICASRSGQLIRIRCSDRKITRFTIRGLKHLPYYWSDVNNNLVYGIAFHSFWSHDLASFACVNTDDLSVIRKKIFFLADDYSLSKIREDYQNALLR